MNLRRIFRSSSRRLRTTNAPSRSCGPRSRKMRIVLAIRPLMNLKRRLLIVTTPRLHAKGKEMAKINVEERRKNDPVKGPG